MRVILKYSRKGGVKYLSHLDMQRLFARALRRAELDVKYSSGFNPHIQMSFASPLSVGFETEGDYLEVEFLSCEIDKVAGLLNDVLPDGIRIIEAFFMPEGRKKLMAMNYSAIYAVIFRFKNEADCVKMKKTVKIFMDFDRYMFEDRKGRQVDIAALTLHMALLKNVLEAELKNSSDGALNPIVLAEALLKNAEIVAEYDIVRRDCCYFDGQKSCSFDALRDGE